MAQACARDDARDDEGAAEAQPVERPERDVPDVRAARAPVMRRPWRIVPVTSGAAP
jgi:hypothetical protein